MLEPLKMSGNKKYRKLYVYQHESEMRTVVHSLEAKEWPDFLIVKATGLTSEQHAEILEHFNTMSERIQKQVLIVPAEWDIEFYGVEVDDADD